jgi:hypothetical protein
MNQLQQNITICFLTLASLILLFFSIKDNVFWGILFASITILLSGIYFIIHINNDTNPKINIKSNPHKKSLFSNGYVFILLFIFVILSLIPSFSFFHTHGTIFWIIWIFFSLYIIIKNIDQKDTIGIIISNQKGMRFWLWKQRHNLFLFFIICIAFFLRAKNLTFLDPYIDEYAHILAARDDLETGAFTYIRAELVTYMVILFQKIGNASTFDNYVFLSRLPGVLFSTLTVLPMYFLAKRISISVGITSALLWATSPWVIGIARTVREYAFYPLIMLTGLLFLIQIKDYLLQPTLLKEKKWSLLWRSIIILSIAIYAFIFDPLSTLKVFTVIILTAIIFFSIKYYKNIITAFKKYQKISLSILFLIGSGVISFLYYVAYGSQTSLTHIQPQTEWILFFLKTGSFPMHWWSNIVDFIFFVPGLIAIGLFFAWKKRSEIYFLNLAIFCSLLISYVFFFTRYIRPRYIFYAEPFFIIIIATSIVGIFYITTIIQSKRARIISYLLSIFFMGCIINYQNIIHPITIRESGYNTVTGEFHDQVTKIIPILNTRITNQDVFISSFAEGILRIEFNIPKEKIHSYDYTNPNRFNDVEHIVIENTSGFIILDGRRNGHWAKGYPRTDFNLGSKNISLLFNDYDIQIYRWGDK